MNFLKYIVSQNLNEILKNHDFIKLYQNNKKFLYKEYEEEIKEYQIFRNEKKNYYKKLYETIDQKFYKKYNWKVLQTGIKVTSIKENSNQYVFIPLNDYKYIWHPNISTLNIQDDNINTIINEYKDINLNTAIRSGNEIIFNCDKYILFNEDYFINILNKKS